MQASTRMLLAVLLAGGASAAIHAVLPALHQPASLAAPPYPQFAGLTFEPPTQSSARGQPAKPEGLAVEPTGALVLVFDDDRAWKDLFAGYEQSDALFALIDPRP